MGTLATIIITIGYGPNSAGIVPDRAAYHADVLIAIARSGYTVAAQIHGDSVSEWGNEPATWISAAGHPADGAIALLRAQLRAVANDHKQDAIGIIVDGRYTEV